MKNFKLAFFALVVGLSANAADSQLLLGAGRIIESAKNPEQKLKVQCQVYNDHIHTWTMVVEKDTETMLSVSDTPMKTKLSNFDDLYAKAKVRADANDRQRETYSGSILYTSAHNGPSEMVVFSQMVPDGTSPTGRGNDRLQGPEAELLKQLALSLCNFPQE